MRDEFALLFDTRGFLPLRASGAWPAYLVWLHSVSDVLTWLACLFLAVVLICPSPRSRCFAFPGMYRMLAACTALGGASYLLEAVAVHVPIYRLLGLVKLAMATCCWITVAVSIEAFRQGRGLWPHVIVDRWHDLHSQTNAWYRAAVDQVRRLGEAVEGYGIRVLDLQGKVATWNEGARRIQGYDARAILGQPWSRFYVPEDVASGKPGRELSAAAAQGQFEGVGRRLRQDGTQFWARVLILPLRDHQECLHGFVEVIREMEEPGALRESDGKDLSEQRRQLGTDGGGSRPSDARLRADEAVDRAGPAIMVPCHERDRHPYPPIDVVPVAPVTLQEPAISHELLTVVGSLLHAERADRERQRARRGIGPWLRAQKDEPRQVCDATIEEWARTLELRGFETEGHSQRVAELTVRVARGMGFDEPALIQVRRGALLHDIGQFGVSNAILSKPGPLNESEWAAVQRHPDLAYQTLAPFDFLQEALAIPYSHHERWDGTGYPRGLRGAQIPLAARVFAVVDVFDSLSHTRPYRAAWPPERVKTHLRSLAGTHLEPEVVEEFLAMIGGQSS